MTHRWGTSAKMRSIKSEMACTQTTKENERDTRHNADDGTVLSGSFGDPSGALKCISLLSPRKYVHVDSGFGV